MARIIMSMGSIFLRISNLNLLSQSAQYFACADDTKNSTNSCSCCLFRHKLHSICFCYIYITCFAAEFQEISVIKR